ncbi:FAS1 domain-containing protein [Lojkania enalia]|uniref:FAS1 domain-containing protein n=1 Tax=Lojkania enalia TaxID=147567 RepID=A0A9P4K790_9PLEO|nr:FAS1 domain-containing protein [Didymosphaeria enalia]
MHRFILLYLLSACVSTHAQTLLEAISTNPSLSNFVTFYSTNEEFARTLFYNESKWPITVLVPNNDAFERYQRENNVSLTDINASNLLALVQYHTLVSNLTKDNFSDPIGATIPTQLDGPQYNNRTAGTSLAAKFGGPERASGQVVFIQPQGESSTSFLLSRQVEGSSSSSVRSGLGSNVNLTALEDNENAWDGGRFHIINGLLTPPQVCSSTIRSAGLVNLDNALNRSGLWPALNGGLNITCLGPSNEAFRGSGNPDATLNETELQGALLHHTLPEVAYSDFLYDGQEFNTLQNTTVRVTVQGEGKDRQIWFNNAKVINANVLAMNGLMHILDSIMLPLDQINATSSGMPSATATPTPTQTQTESPTGSGTTATTSGAAAPLSVSRMNWNLLGLFSAILVLS